jgi:hypothetical protein
MHDVRYHCGHQNFACWLFLAINGAHMLAAQNDLTFLRVRSKKHEIMVAPDKDYLLIIIQNPYDV